jgi:hypothetical protein
MDRMLHLYESNTVVRFVLRPTAFGRRLRAWGETRREEAP